MSAEKLLHNIRFSSKIICPDPIGQLHLTEMIVWILLPHRNTIYLFLNILTNENHFVVYNKMVIGAYPSENYSTRM